MGFTSRMGKEVKQHEEGYYCSYIGRFTNFHDCGNGVSWLCKLGRLRINKVFPLVQSEGKGLS